MHLYFNKYGMLTTTIPHGEPVRQGSNLNLYFCFDEDYFDYNKLNKDEYNLNVSLILPGQNELQTAQVVSLSNFNEPVQFRQKDDSEITYDLVDKKYYWIYKVSYTPEQSTMLEGQLIVVSWFMKVNGEKIDDEIYLGTAEIHVEKTFGSSGIVFTKSNEHYDNLLAQINDVAKTKIVVVDTLPNSEDLKKYYKDRVMFVRSEMIFYYINPDGEKKAFFSDSEVNYETQVYNKPKINDVELIGNKKFSDLGLYIMTETDIDDIINSVENAVMT